MYIFNFVLLTEPISNCPDGYFECDSGQCINELYICNSVVDCDDGSDEYRCSAEDPLPAEQIDADQDMQTDGKKGLSILIIVYFITKGTFTCTVPVSLIHQQILRLNHTIHIPGRCISCVIGD